MNLLLSTGLLLIALNSFSQIDADGSWLIFDGQYSQVKDQKNYGLVFHGGNLQFGYAFEATYGNNKLKYDAAFGFGPGFSKGIASINFRLKPADISYSFQLGSREKFAIFLGPYISMNYFFHLYPELQSGHALWSTFYDLGPVISAEMQLWDQDFRISLSTSVAGLVSRPVELNESYYYSLNFSDLVSMMHSNFEFGSSNLFIHNDFEIEWIKIKGTRNSLAYRLEYFDYSQQASVEYLVHSISYHRKLGGNK